VHSTEQVELMGPDYIHWESNKMELKLERKFCCLQNMKRLDYNNYTQNSSDS
jgi:hypothetical protein